MKTNFRKDEITDTSECRAEPDARDSDLTQEEFEEYISKSGAKGSFMVYRSVKKDEEMGLDEL